MDKKIYVKPVMNYIESDSLDAHIEKLEILIDNMDPKDLLSKRNAQMIKIVIEAARDEVALEDQISFLAKSLAEERERSQIDNKTNTLNERGLINALETYIKRAEEKKENFAYVLIDLDRFKSFNDEYNYSVGDLVLKCVAETIKRYTDPKDKIARDGGDEFQILIYGTKKEETIGIVERLDTKIKKEVHKNVRKGIIDMMAETQKNISRYTTLESPGMEDQEDYKQALDNLQVCLKYLNERPEDEHITASIGFGIYYGGTASNIDQVANTAKTMAKIVKNARGVAR